MPTTLLLAHPDLKTQRHLCISLDCTQSLYCLIIFPVKDCSTAGESTDDSGTDDISIAKAIFDVIKKVGDGVFSIIKLVKIFTPTSKGGTTKEETKDIDRNDINEMDLAEFTKLYPNCFSSKRHFIGDDWCDDENNNGDIYVLKGK